MINAFCVSYFQNYDRFKKRRKKNSAWIMNNCLRISTSGNKYLSKLLITAKKKNNVEKQQKTKMCIGLEQCCIFVYVFDVAIYRFGTVLYPCILWCIRYYEYSIFVYQCSILLYPQKNWHECSHISPGEFVTTETVLYLCILWCIWVYRFGTVKRTLAMIV